MDILYKIYDNFEEPDYISRALRQLKTGNVQRDVVYLFQIIKHPTKNLVAIRLEMDYVLKVCPEATPDDLINYFKAYITPDEEVGLRNLFYSGQDIVFSQIVPAAMVPLLRTPEELEADGWFDE